MLIIIEFTTQRRVDRYQHRAQVSRFFFFFTKHFEWLGSNESLLELLFSTKCVRLVRNSDEYIDNLHFVLYGLHNRNPRSKAEHDGLVFLFYYFFFPYEIPVYNLLNLIDRSILNIFNFS